MGERSRCFRLVLLILVLMLAMPGCSGLSRLYEDETARATAATHEAAKEPTETSTPDETPPPEPGATLPPGVQENTRFYADLDGDGEDETIIVGSVANDDDFGSSDISLYILNSTTDRYVLVDIGYFESAYLVYTPSGEPCTIVCCGDSVDAWCTTSLCSFDGLTPVLQGREDGQVIKINGDDLTLTGWTEFIGCWDYTCKYTLTDDFKLKPSSGLMIVTAGREPLHTIRELPVEMKADGGYAADTLPADSLLYPTTGDGESYMEFRLENGLQGRITYTRDESYEAMINGVSEYEYFDNIEYWG